MNIKPIIIDVDFKRNTIMKEHKVRHGDNIPLMLRVFDDGEAFDLSTMQTISLVITRLDRQTIVLLGTVFENQATFNLGGKELAVSGNVQATAQFYSVDGRVSTFNFKLIAESDPMTNYTPLKEEETLIVQVLKNGPTIIEAAQIATVGALQAEEIALSAAETTNQSKEKLSAAVIGALDTLEKDKAKVLEEMAEEKALTKQVKEDTLSVKNEVLGLAKTVGENGDYAKTEGDRAKKEADRLEGTDVSVLDNKITSINNNLTTQLADTAKKSELTATGKRIDELVIGSGNANAEVTDAHVSTTKNKTFPTLTNRLEAMESDTYSPVTNLVLNGDFSEGITGWTGAGNHDTITVADKMTFNGLASAGAGRYQDITIPTGNKIAIVFNYSNGGATNPMLQLGDRGAFTNLSPLTYSTGSNVIITTAKTNGVRIYFQQLQGITYTNAIFDNVIVIDLTATYGVGNEPTKDELNLLLNSFPNRWFKGTTNSFNAKNITNQIKEIKNNQKGSSDNLYNVKDYGAKGDGITDDSIAIQSALNAANSTGGGTVYFPRGTFLVASTLKVYSNTTLLGQSRWNSIVQLSANSMVALFNCSGTSTSTNKNISFESLHLKHVLGISGSPTVDGKGVLIYANYTVFCQVNRCVFSNYTFSAIYLNRTIENSVWAHSWQIHNNIFQGNVALKQISNACYYGVWLDQEAEYVDISSNQFFYMQVGVYMSDSPNHRINNNTIDMCNDAIKHTALAYRTNGKLLITSNTLNHCYNSGINIQVRSNKGNPSAMQSGCIISNNMILLPHVNGIIITGGIGHVCTGNKIINSNLGDNGIVLSDFGQDSPLIYSMITHNVIQSNVANGVGKIDTSRVVSSIDSNIIDNNILAKTPF